MPHKIPKYILICILATSLLVGLVLSYLNPQDDSESVLNTLSSNPALSEKPFTTKAPIDPDILAGRTFSPHVPIEIAKNTDFNETNGVTAGDGSAGDPFIIEGWNITSPNVSCISIHDTTAYFIIQNCLLNSSAYHSANGIYIGYVSSGTANITNNICTNTDVAITISNSPDADVTSNYCQDNTYALVVEYSNTVNISHNHFTDHTWGVEISDTNSLIFYNNTVNVSFYNGVEIYACNSPLLENNTISRSGERGISLVSTCDNLRLINNTFIDDGLYTFYNYDILVNADLIADNLINGKPLGIFIDVQDLSIPSPYGQLFLINCTNVTVENQNCSSSSMGIALYECADCLIKNNTCSNNDKFGVYAFNSNGTIIKNNTLNGDWTGVRLWESNYTTIYNNTMKYTHFEGIYAQYVSHLNISFNLFYSTGFKGIQLETSKSSLITRNIIYDCWDAIKILGCKDCEISWNNFTSNLDYGVSLEDWNLPIPVSTNNTIHHNSFVDNNSPQAYDEGTNNLWYDPVTEEGNYWSDYDGLGDPYVIAGPVSSLDTHPLDINFDPLPVPEFPAPLAFSLFLVFFTLGVTIVKKGLKLV